MNARFAEVCSADPMALIGAEQGLELRSVADGASERDRLLSCDKDIYIGVFFDGTNNNKYRDTPGFSQSNVARLYEVYPGTHATQTAPVLRPRVVSGGTAPRPLSGDEAFRPASVKAEDFPYYRKIYIPGLGTPMPDVGDSGASFLQTLGLAFAFMGQIRLTWALMQLVNQVHAAVFKMPLESSIDLRPLLRQSTHRLASLNPVMRLALGGSEAAQRLLGDKLANQEALIGSLDTAALEAALSLLESRLAKALKQRGDNKPLLRKVRLSVFGFSRGAAAARAWVNLVVNRWGDSLGGVSLQIDFLGVFDTVASVGSTPALPRAPGRSSFEGHATWASTLSVPPSVKRCVHLVAAMEVRGSFPLDSICQGNALPPNCKEIVYPGVHSDVGGGYAPDEQGRALGLGAAGDPFKLSQIPLAQMYREARMGGVPLAPRDRMIDVEAKPFEIAPQLREDFNAYVVATRTASVPPTNGKGEAAFARMFPTETQPREELFRVTRRHYGFMLRWRKTLLARPRGIAGLNEPLHAKGDSRFQDIEDLRGAEHELRKELSFLLDTSAEKFAVLDDPLAQLQAFRAAGWPLMLVIEWIYAKSFPELMRQKQREWDTWIRHEWEGRDEEPVAAACARLFERHVHDSRAWFKPGFRSDRRLAIAPNDEDWFVYGGREKELAERGDEFAMRRADLERTARTTSGPVQKQAKLELALLSQEGQLLREGQPLIRGSREPYQMWGYLRHRGIYQSGKWIDSTAGARDKKLDAEENERVLERSRADQIAAENARHQAERDKIMARNREVIRENRLDDQRMREFMAGSRQQIEQENRLHEEQLRVIRKETSLS